MKSALESSQEHIWLLGIITARWAKIDVPLWFMISQLLKVKIPEGLVIYFSSNSQKLRFDMIDGLLNVSKLEKHKITEGKRLIKRAKNLYSNRNKIIHCYATEGDQKRSFNIIQHRPAFNKFHEEIPLTLKFLSDHAEAVAKLGDDLVLFIAPYVAQSVLEQTSPDKSQSQLLPG
jgi:hypothetical protein